MTRTEVTRWLLCSFLGWHNGSGQSAKRGLIAGFDGLSLHATCSRCGKEVMMDSQGNWF